MIWSDGPVSVHCGDVREVLAQLPEESVQCVVTSPPYWGLRDYGVEGQRGLEPTPEEYVANMVAVFREVRRVLRKDGTLWLNMGDSYAVNGGARSYGSTDGAVGRGDAPGALLRAPMGLKSKDLIGMPWRIAFALQADGWWLRSDIVWAKPNPMPESVTDRPTRSHEYLFLLTRSARYYYDADAIRTPFSLETKALSFETMDFARRDGYKAGQRIKMPDGWDTGPGGHGSFHRNGREKGAYVTDREAAAAAAEGSSSERRREGLNGRWDEAEANGTLAGANARSVWTIATQAYPDAHFATYPEALVIPCIKAGSREGDTVLDPFAGSGTTLAVARRLGRRSVGIELNPDYLPLIQRRVAGSSLPLLETLNGSVVSTETDQASAGQPDYVSRAVLHGTRPTDTP